MSVTKRGTSWQLDYYDEHGERRRISVDAPTKEQAKRMLGEIKLDVARRKQGLEVIAPNPLGLTVADLAAWWLAGPAKGHAKHDALVGSVKKRIVTSAIGDVRADRVTRALLEQWMTGLEAAGYAPRTVNHARAHLSAIFNAAIRAGKVTVANPVTTTKTRKVKKAHLETLTLAEVRALLATVEDPTRAIYACALFTGMRRGEMWALRKDCVDLDAGVITVRASNERGQTKSGKVRLVPIHPELRPHLARIMLAYVSPLVFPQPRTGEMRSASSKSSRDLQAALKRAGINRKLRFHDLRHTAATLLLQAGVDLKLVSQLLGHSSIALTADTYAHMLVDDVRRGMERLQVCDRGVTGAASDMSEMSPNARRGVL